MGLVLQFAMSISDTVGKGFIAEISFWGEVMNHQTASMRSKAFEHSIRRPTTRVIAARMLMSGLVNFSMSVFLLIMTPLLLAESGDEITFIFNACALNYITSLDEVEEKEFRFFRVDESEIVPEESTDEGARVFRTPEEIRVQASLQAAYARETDTGFDSPEARSMAALSLALRG